MKPAETFSITADDGHRFEASLHATADPTAPVLLFLPALGTPGRVYRGFATALAAQGVQVCITDWRGMASSSVRASREHNHGYQTLVETDVTALLAQLARRVPQAALWVGKRLGLTQYGPEQLRFLRYRPVLANTRLKTVFGYVPRKTSAEVFDFWWAARRARDAAQRR